MQKSEERVNKNYSIKENLEKKGREKERKKGKNNPRWLAARKISELWVSSSPFLSKARGAKRFGGRKRWGGESKRDSYRKLERAFFPGPKFVREWNSWGKKSRRQSAFLSRVRHSVHFFPSPRERNTISLISSFFLVSFRPLLSIKLTRRGRGGAKRFCGLSLNSFCTGVFFCPFSFWITSLFCVLFLLFFLFLLLIPRRARLFDELVEEIVKLIFRYIFGFELLIFFESERAFFYFFLFFVLN